MKKAMNLAELPVNADGNISQLVGDLTLVSRLRELGFIMGEHIRVAGRMPFGDPILVEIRGATVALRIQEAKCVMV